MIRQLLPVGALLMGSALLLFAGGINSLVLPIRGNAEGFTATALGLLGTGWALGYVAGCIVCPRLVAAVGHIRAFAVLCAFAAIAILLQAIIIDPWAWIPLRAISGFSFAGAAMVVESWLSDRATPDTRGRIFGVYTMVNLAASTAGQLVLALGDATGFLFFALGAVFYCLALVPTAGTVVEAPLPLARVSLDLRALWRNSPVAVAAVALVGVSNASFGTLAAVYADRVGLDLSTIALFASIPILAGALAQWPIGILSDRMDRRVVLLGTAVVALLADAGFLLLAPQGQLLNLALAAVFGAAVFAMYPVIVAHANDHAAPGTSIQISGGLLMIFGMGSIVGPLASGAIMANAGPTGLFMTTAVAHVAMILFTLLRMRRRAAMSPEEKTAFRPSVPARVATPQTAVLAEADG